MISRKILLTDFRHIIEESVSIPVPMSPGKWVDKKIKYTPILQLRVSCGGGIGGAQWLEHIKSPSDLEDFKEKASKTKLLHVIRYDDTEVLINIDNVVEVTPYVMACTDFDNENDNYPTGVITLRRLLSDDSVKIDLI